MATKKTSANTEAFSVTTEFYSTILAQIQLKYNELFNFFVFFRYFYHGNRFCV